MLKMNISYKILGLAVGIISLTSCYEFNQKADPENLSSDPGVEYAPQMYHSEAYDPMSQITNTESGMDYWPWEELGEDLKHGEWYNSNHYNPHGMNVRVPAEGSISRGFLPYSIPKDSLDLANSQPVVWAFDIELVDSVAQLSELGVSQKAEAELLYRRYCSHCHGNELDGKGAVASKFPGVANLVNGPVKMRTASYIYHIITVGKNNMRSHASQVSAADRWKIAAYIKELHN